MSITITWDDSSKHETLRYEFVGSWDWQELNEVNRYAFNLIEVARHPVGVIFDMERSGTVPPGALGEMWEILSQAPANMSMIAVTSTDSLTMHLFKVLRQLDPGLSHQLFLCKTVDEARKLVSSVCHV